MQKVMLTAFGETKPILYWSRDPRCKPKRSLLSKRIRDGWGHYEAITTPIERKIPLEIRIKMLKNKKHFNEWVVNHPNATREQIRKRVDSIVNKDKYYAKQREYSITEKGRANRRARVNKWRKENPLATAYHEVLRREREMATPESLMVTPIQLAEIKEIYGKSCCYCGSTEKLEVEHIDPVSKGGLNTVSNILFACRSCNSSKNNYSLLNWFWKTCPKPIFNNNLTNVDTLNKGH